MNSATASTAIHNEKELRKRDAMQAEMQASQVSILRFKTVGKVGMGTYDKNLALAVYFSLLNSSCRVSNYLWQLDITLHNMQVQKT